MEDILISWFANEHYVIRIPDSLPLDAAAPLLCAGITVYSPLNYFELNKPGMHIGVVGLGGLGHVAVKFAKAFGVKVTVISTSPTKEKEAIEHLGADSFLVSKNQEQMEVIIYASTEDFLSFYQIYIDDEGTSLVNVFTIRVFDSFRLLRAQWMESSIRFLLSTLFYH